MKGLVVNVETQKAQFLDVPYSDESFEELYAFLDIDTVELAYRKVENKTKFVFILDENGLLKNEPIISGVDTDMNVAFVGTYAVLGLNKDGSIRELNDDEVELLKRNVRYVSTVSHPFGLLVLSQIERGV